MRRDRLLHQRLHCRFVVTLNDGATFDGLLAGVDARVVRLVDAGAVGLGTQRTPVDGELFIERDRIRYMQKPPS